MDFSSFDPDSAFRVILNGLRVDAMLLLQYPCSKDFGIIILIHRNHGLDNDRPRIDPFVRKMDRAS